VSEYVNGPDLESYLNQRGVPLAPGELWPLARGIAAGIDHAHECGVVHFGIKPANVLIRRFDWAPKLVDFGVAFRLEGSYALSAVWAGTPFYMAPEVWRLADPSAADDAERLRLRRADVYSFALLLYRCLAGCLPLPYPTIRGNRLSMPELGQVQSVTLSGVLLPSPLIPAPAWQVLRAALDTDSQCRPARAGELVEWLQQAWSRPALAAPVVGHSDLDGHGRPRWIVRPPDDAPMVLIPAQRFRLGHDTAGRDDNRPAHEYDVADFYLDAHPVTNRQFARFVWEARPAVQNAWEAYYQPGANENHPVRAVPYEDVEQNCRWAGKGPAAGDRVGVCGTRRRRLVLSVGRHAARAWAGRSRARGRRSRPGRRLPRLWLRRGRHGRESGGTGPRLVQCHPVPGPRCGQWDGVPAGPDGHKALGARRVVEGAPEELMTIARGMCDPDVPDPRVGFRAIWHPSA
jgi:hypothetical protein